ncbi:MAG: LLM class F420-dependent oxidoreductase, partial [Thiohalocapsa sp.]
HPLVDRLAHGKAGVPAFAGTTLGFRSMPERFGQKGSGMKIGFFAVGIGAAVEPEAVRAVAVAAERLGFATLWAPEHVVLVEQYASRYPYSSAGLFPGGSDVPIADPFATLAYAAACTTTIRLGTGICLVPEHNPLILAKTAATLDRLSGGRLVFGAGVGWLAEEFAALGVPFEHRGARTREYVEVMRQLWRERSSTHAGRFVNFSGVTSRPKPANGSSIPVWFGGESEAALRRVAAYGDGWIGFRVSPADAGPKIRRIEELLREGGRKRSDVTLAVSPYADPITPDDLKRYRDAGAEEVALLLRGRAASGADIVAGMERLAKDFVEPAAKL